jgi:AraC-like DNA-binding protein
MRVVKNRSVFIRYIVSYALVVIMAGILLGVFLLVTSVRQISQAHTRLNQAKLESMVNDIENQFDVYSDIALDIRIRYWYKPDYFRKNKYYETELLDDFSKYSAYSPLVDDYFLYYQHDDILFRGSGTSMEVETYFRNHLSYIDYASDWERILSLDKPGMLIGHTQQGACLFFVFPIEIIGVPANAVRAVLVFLAREQTLIERISFITGYQNVQMTFYYEGFAQFELHRTEPDMAIKLIQGSNSAFYNLGDQMITAEQEGRLFQLSAMKTDFPESDVIIRYQNSSILIIISIVVLLLFAGLYMAYLNYKPIRRLQDVLFGDPGKPGKDSDELKNIEISYLQVRQTVQHNQSIIRNQVSLLHQQMIEFILREGLHDETRQKAEEMGIKLIGPGFAVLAIDPGDDTFQYQSVIDYLTRQKEQDNHADIQIHPGHQSTEHICHVLLDLKRHSAGDLLTDETYSRFVKQFPDTCKIGISSTVKNIKLVKSALLEAYSALKRCQATAQTMVFFDNIDYLDEWAWYNEEWTLQLYRAMKKHDKTAASAVIQAIVTQLETQQQSYVFQRFIYSDLLTVMMKAARDLKLSFRTTYISSMLTANSPAEFADEAMQLIHLFCQQLDERNTIQDDQKLGDLIGYIEAHYCDYNMSLDLLSELFGYSVTQLSHLIKRYVGEPFRVYLISLRMEKARNLLMTTDMTIADITQAVGYGSTSHFIKTFRLYYGNNPSYYRTQ